MCGPNIDSISATQIRKGGCSAGTLARLNMAETIIKSPTLFRDPLNKDSHITGQVGGRAKKASRPITWGNPGGNSNQPNLMYPASRPSRPIGDGGARSFHLAEELAHTKPTASKSGAKARQNYTLDASKVPIVEAELAGLALQRGLYLFRDAVKVEKEGLRLAITNMGSNDETVVASWKLIEETETRKVDKIILPHLSINKLQSENHEFWDRLLREPDVPIDLKEFLNSKDAAAVSFMGDRLKPIECFLRKNGWHDRSNGKTRPDVKFHAGRNPISQRRLVLELPSGLSLEAVERVIHELANEFHKRDLPFVLVVHRPDETNHEKNWHIHLDYHHRPMKRFDPANYVLPNAPMETETKRSAQHAIKKRALANPDPSWTGKWDAEIEFEYRTDSGRKKVSRPFLQDCHPDVNEDSWLGNLRCRYSEIVNTELEKLGSAIRFDPRSLEERGISKISDEHLGLKKSHRERWGKPTKKGAQNEQNQWDFEHAELLRLYPEGDRPDGKPEHVTGYVTGFLKLIHQRLQSRPKYVSYYAHRQTDADDQANPTPSTIRRNKRRDYRVEWLAEQADRALDNINEAWMGISSWAADMTIKQDHEPKIKRDGVRSQTPQSKSEHSTPRSSSITDDTVAKAQPDDLKPAELRSAHRARVKSASETASESGTADRKSLSFEDKLAVLRKHQVQFKIGRATMPNSGWALTANLSDADAEKHALPTKIVAHRSEERRLLLDLHRELCKPREEPIRLTAKAPAEQHGRPQREQRGSAPDSRQLFDAKPFSFDAVFPHDLRDQPTPRLSGMLPRANGGADEHTAVEGDAAPTSIVEGTQGKTIQPQPRDTPTAAAGTAKESPTLKGSEDIAWAFDLIANGKLRKTVICPMSDEKVLVCGPDSDTRTVALAGLPAALAADLLVLADTQELELQRIANFIARNSAQLSMERWREALPKSETGMEMGEIFDRWSENADFRRAVDRVKMLSVSDDTDAQAIDEHKRAFFMLMFRDPEAESLLDGLANRTASPGAKQIDEVSPKNCAAPLGGAATTPAVPVGEGANAVDAAEKATSTTEADANPPLPKPYRGPFNPFEQGWDR